MKKSARPSPALMSMLPPAVRQSLLELERERDDDAVSAKDWEAHAMELMREANSLPGPIRDAFGRAIKQLGAAERRENQSARSRAREIMNEERAGTPGS